MKAAEVLLEFERRFPRDLVGRLRRSWQGTLLRLIGTTGPRIILAAAACVMTFALLAAGSTYTYLPLSTALAGAPPATDPGASAPSSISQLRREHQRLRSALRRTVPRGVYLVVDRSNNRVYLRQSDRVRLEAVASAGSGHVLHEESGRRRTWVFDTPQGSFRVLSKISDPVWKKPDWAFVEEGKPIPTDPRQRIEYGTLGEYALYFGDGFMIHGTLYERLLGRPVTHGCIRLGRDDLRQVYRATAVGTPIYIF
ncbi:MAG: L,D-transpeptidase [Gemmatimonadota bacterium]|nr:MAG: L,D-transpeptidase [Gemmatimonadota bacterium]